MATDKILGFFHWVINSLWDALPSWNTTVTSAPVHEFATTLKRFDSFLPVSNLFICIGVLGTIYGATWALKGLFKLIGWVRGSG